MNQTIRIARLAAVVAAALCTGVPVHSLAGQTIKFKSKHINVLTKFESGEVGDRAGHLIGFYTLKGAGTRIEGPQEPPYKIEIWGTGDYAGDGTGKDSGYGKFTFSDGSSYYEVWSGTSKGGRGSGTATYYNGTGRFEGMKGGSKWDCALLDDRGVCDVDGTIELP